MRDHSEESIASTDKEDRIFLPPNSPPLASILSIATKSEALARNPPCGEKRLALLPSLYKLGSNASLFSPQGGLRASASDLVAILSMLARGGELGGRKILSSLSVDAMLSSEWSLNQRGDNGHYHHVD